MQIEAVISLIEGDPGTANKKELALLLNEMILHRFDLLVTLLYRVDVPEQDVKQQLREQPEADAGMLLAELLLQRQQQKNAARKNTAPGKDYIPDEERW